MKNKIFHRDGSLRGWLTSWMAHFVDGSPLVGAWLCDFVSDELLINGTRTNADKRGLLTWEVRG